MIQVIHGARKARHPFSRRILARRAAEGRGRNGSLWAVQQSLRRGRGAASERGTQ